MKNDPIIVIKDLTKRYAHSKQMALNHLNMSINKGEFFGLLGPNGSGKTTLISIICGLLKASSGEATIAGQIVPRQMGRVKHILNLVPQEIALYPTLTLKENIHFFGKMYGLGSKLLKERTEECLEIAGLTDSQDLPIGTFSGGMQRRANLIMSLVNHPEILFLDEPAAHVDPQSRNLIFNILNSLNQKGATIIYTTHYLEEAQYLCERVVILDNGQILCNDSPMSLIKQTPHANNLADVFFHLTGKEVRDDI